MGSRNLLASTAVLLAALSAYGCSGGQPKWGGMSEEAWRKQYQEKQEAEAREESEAKKRVGEETQTEDKKRTFAGSARTHLMQEEGNEPRSTLSNGRVTAAVEKETLPSPSLPEEFGDWTERDYRNARAWNAGALPAAVQYLGGQSPGDEHAAELLVSLLSPSSGADATGNRKGKSRPRKPAKRESTRLVETIVAALAANGTELARATLEQLIGGRFHTEDDETAAIAAVKGLADNPTSMNDAMLFRLLTAPEEARPSGQGQLSPHKLQEQAVELLRPSATSGLRLELAEHLVDPNTPREERDLLSKLVDPAQPDALKAQLVLLRSPLTPARAKLEIEAHLTAFSSDVLAYMWGLPENAAGVASDPEWLRRVVGQLWSPAFSTDLERRLNRLVSLKEGIQPVLLACTVPTDSVRTSLYRTLQRRWTDGPADLASAGLTGEVISDPGLILLVQMLLDEHAPDAGSRRSTQRLRGVVSTHPPTQRRTAAGRLNQIKVARDVRREMLTRLADDWLAVLDSLEQSLCRRLHATAMQRATARHAASHGLASTPESCNLPVELHADAHVIAAHHVDWCKETRRAFPTATPDPMEVHYVRIEETTRPAKMLGTYRRRLKDCTLRGIEHGVALESLQTGSQPGRKQFVSVRIASAAPEIPRLPNEDQPLIVEILSVEINNPSDAAWKTGKLTEN